MNSVHISVPGKLMLSGEYAVLCGAPAVVMAVDRNVSVSIHPSDHPASRVWARPLHERAFEFDLHETGLWRQPEPAARALGLTGRLLPALVRELEIHHQRQSVDVLIDSSALHDRDLRGRSVKLGLGSSAAVAVALLRAFVMFFDRSIDLSDRDRQLAILLPIYRAALQSAASGADLAACVYGGLVSVRSNDRSITVRRLQWLSDLQWRAVWTCKSAQTTDHVARFKRWSGQDPNAKSIIAELSMAAEQVESAFVQADGEQVHTALSWFTSNLSDMDANIAAAGEQSNRIVTADHRKLSEMAAAHKVFYKSCGSGGGDLGIAISPDSAGLNGFTDGLSCSGARPLELCIANID